MSTLANSHALVVGIADYPNINKLPPAVTKDATDVYSMLVDPSICGYPSANVTLLIDCAATLSGIRRALSNLAANTTPDSVVLLYVSSHGGRIESGAHAGNYLLPADTIYESSVTLAQTSLSGEELAQLVHAIPARKLVMVLDCCHAGGIGQAKGPGEPAITSGLSEHYCEVLAAGRGRVVLASSRQEEVSWILPGAQNSLFTGHLLAGFRGGALGCGGVIRIFDLFDYVQPRVTADQPCQHPVFKAELEDNFAVALHPGGNLSASAGRNRARDAFAYDAFVSYCHRDKAWIRNTLVPALERKGLKTCIDQRDFRVGAPLVTEMERAVVQSRYEIAVLTPAYLSSNFAQFESVLAQHLGLEQSQRRLLAILREDCQPPLRIRSHLWLDMTDDSTFDSDIERLIYELQQPQ